MQPTKILSITPTRLRTGKTYLWKCDNGSTYLTKDMAEIIGKSAESLLQSYYRKGLDNKALWKPSGFYAKSGKKAAYRGNPQKNILTCDVGDIVIHKGKRVSVGEILMFGSEDRVGRYGRKISGEKSVITVCRIMDNGQILKNSPFYAGEDWVHV